jgi:hypothetical protein
VFQFAVLTAAGNCNFLKKMRGIYKYTFHWRPVAATHFMEAYPVKVCLSVRDMGRGGGRI